MSKTTIQKLNMTQAQYDEMMFGSYARWCESVTINNRSFQKVLANAAIARWYMTEYGKCEAEFHQLTNDYDALGIALKEYQKVYADCTFSMFNIKPSALLNDIKKTDCNSLASIHGIKVQCLTFNEN